VIHFLAVKPGLNKTSAALSTRMDKHRLNTLQDLETVLLDTSFCFPTLLVLKGFLSQKNEKYIFIQNYA